MNEKNFLRNKEKIYRMYINAYENPFYKKRMLDKKIVSFNQFDYQYFSNNIPVIEKKDLLGVEETLLPQQITRSKLFFDDTSGTDGEPLRCYMGEKEKILFSKKLWSIRKSIVPNLNINDKVVQFYSSRHIKGRTITDAVVDSEKQLLLSLFDLSEPKLKLFIETISNTGCQWLHAVPSAVLALARVINQYALRIPELKYIELTGEYISEEEFKYIKETFKTTVINHYGLREFWTIGYGEGNILEINEENVFVENDTFSSENTGILVTSLSNSMWPLIRYRVKDNVKLVEKDDEFKLKIMGGRHSEYIELCGTSYNSIVFSYVVREINRRMKGTSIIKYQIHKLNSNEILFIVVLEQKKQKSLVEKHLKNIGNEVLPSICIEMKVQSEIELSFESGKKRTVIDKTID